MQSAELLVEIDEPCGHTDGPAAALEGRLGIVDRVGERGLKGTKATLQLARGGEVEQLFLCTFDLLPGRIVEILIESLVDNVLTKRNQLTPKIKIVDVLTVILGVYNRHCRVNKLSEILRSADFCQRFVLIKQVFERHRVGDLTTLDQLSDCSEDPTVHGIA